MTRPATIPAPGTPIQPAGGLREVLARLASAANKEDSPPSGLVGREGSFAAPPPTISIALFQLTGNFTSAALPEGETWPYQPAASWQHAPATQLEYYPADGTWNTPDAEGDTSTTPTTAEIWHNAGYQLGSVDPDRDLPATLATASQFMPAAGNGQWVWCFHDEGPGCWVMLQSFEDILRVKLTQNLNPCGAATAVVLIAQGDADESMEFTTSAELTVYDPLATAEADVLSVADAGGNWHIPSGTYAYVKRFADNNAWEPLRYAPGCQFNGSGSGTPIPDDGECPVGYAPSWTDISVNGKTCKIRVCCPIGSGSSSGSCAIALSDGNSQFGSDPGGGSDWQVSLTGDGQTLSINIGGTSPYWESGVDVDMVYTFTDSTNPPNSFTLTWTQPSGSGGTQTVVDLEAGTYSDETVTDQPLPSFSGGWKPPACGDSISVELTGSVADTQYYTWGPIDGTVG